MRRPVTLLFTFALAAAAQKTPEPTFHAATKLVEIDVVAHARNAPVTGLTKEDFSLFDNGHQQKIAFFSVRSSRAPSSTTPAAPLLQSAVTNRLDRDTESPSNPTIILLDQRNTSQADQGFAIQRVVRFLHTRRTGASIGLYTFLRDNSLNVVQEITDNPVLLNRAADSLRARDPSFRSNDTTGMTEHATDDHMLLELMDRGMAMKRILRATARHLAGVPGRKSLIWVTTSFPLTSLKLGIDFNPDMEEAARDLNDANVSLYAVDARGLIGALDGLTALSNAETMGPPSARASIQQMRRGEPPNPSGLDTMNKLAGLTGGLVYFNKSNAIEESIQKAEDDGQLTYALGFYPAGEEDRTWHELKVDVAKKGVNLRYRQAYFASNAPTERPTLESLLKNSLDATQLRLIAEATPDRSAVKLNIALDGLQLRQENGTHSGTIDVSILVDGSREVRTHTLKIDIADDRFAALLEHGLDTTTTIDGPPGARFVRIVVQDRATGATGSVTLPWPGR
jgi:VWFA-related protein